MTDTDKLKGYRRGAVDYISVPIDPEILLAKVTVFADLHRQSRQLDRLNRELQTLSSRLMTLQDEERRRVSRELHEGLGQDLVAAKMMVDGMNLRDHSIEENEQARNGLSSLMESIIKKVRGISHLLHPPLLDEAGLRSTVQWYLEELNQRSGIDTSLEVQPSEFPRLKPETETAIFRIIQEALSNVFRHSGARHASVSLVAANGNVVVIVRDDGNGVADSTAGIAYETRGSGLGAMKQRALDLGGELRVQNTHPGTVVEVNIPHP